MDDDRPVLVDHPSALPATWTGSTTNATAAINLWRNSGMDLDLRDGGATFRAGQCSADFTGNGRIAVAYNDPCGGVADWVSRRRLLHDRRSAHGERHRRSRSSSRASSILNNVGPHTSSAGCFQDAVTHGLGHALGLGHSNSAGAIMAAPPPIAAPRPRGLGADDTAGVTAIYQGIAQRPDAARYAHRFYRHGACSPR